MIMTETIRAVLPYVLGAGLLGFVQFLITRGDGRRREKASAEKERASVQRAVERLEKDSLRTQMLVLMSDYPDAVEALMTVSQRYFEELHGDWYMTSVFRKHIAEHSIECPVWLKD